ncbi:MAG TPA: OmpA family protein [Polyangiaceae bacterium]|nr:OmpA family protein [Polyangiaceae bacterium]
MNAKLTTASAVAIALVSAAQAHAQTASAPPESAPPEGEKGYLDQDVPAPTNALELSVGTGYTQGFGSMQSGVNLQDVITPGIGVDFGVAYRFHPRWAIGLVGQWQGFEPERATSANGLTAGLAASYHFSPYTRTDPWLQLGTGYRMLWESHDTSPTLLTHGFELGKVQLGVDIRVDKDVALAPVIGADLSLPLWQSVGGGTSVAITDPRVSTYVFAGLQARFDVTSTHDTGKPPVMAKAPPPVVITQAEVAPKPPPPIEETKPVSPSISVSEEVLQACQMDLNNIEKAPKFDFDKSQLLAEDEAVLEKIAECFSTGPLKGKDMLLVGRADPRGAVNYNQKLGMRRANAVSDALERLGVGKDQIQPTSRGELDATGTDESTWAIDRRVDILLVHH